MMALAKSILLFLGGVLMLTGFTIGAGMFAIPFSFATAGFWLGTAELLALLAIVLLVHVSYAEVAVKTKGSHRLPGYAAMYLGSWGRAVASASIFTGVAGTLLVYLILGSQFLANTLRAGGLLGEWRGSFSAETVLVLLLAAVGALITFFPLRGEATINGVLTAALIAFIGFLIYRLTPFIASPPVLDISFAYAAVPYGVLLFSLWGGIVVPDVAALLGKSPGKTKWAVIVGTVLPALVYFLFAFAVVGVSGDETSREAFQGLSGIVEEKILLLGFLIGLLAVFTSFLAMQKTFQAMLEFDFGAPRNLAWAGGSVLPIFLYVFGFTDFIAVISLVGAVAIGVDILIILLVHSRTRALAGEVFPWYAITARAMVFVVILGAIVYHLFGGA